MRVSLYDIPAGKQRLSTLFAWAVLLGFIIASRLVYAPPYLYTFDNANFAFAIDHFDPRLHQPQPPGYPLYVVLLKALNIFLHSANHALILSGLIGSVAGIMLTWLWAALMFGNQAGWIASVLLAVHPVFWVAGIVNPVRTFLVVIAAATAILGWRCMTEADPRPWFYSMAGTLGLLAGFRPECLVLLFPLWIAAGWYGRVGSRAWLISGAILGGSALVWIAPLIIYTGGIRSTYSTFFDYVRHNSEEYVVAFGATASAGAATIRRVLTWNFGLAIAWIWAVPFALSRLSGNWTRVHTLLLSCSFVPPFLFHALVHVRDVDQTLITIPVVCVLGGAVLSSVRPRAVMSVAVAVAVLISGWNFRRPMFHDMAAASRGAMRFMNDWNRSTFSALDSLAQDRDSVLVWDDSVVSWRQISYYYPNSRLLVVQPEYLAWSISDREEPAALRDGAVLVPNFRLLVLGVSYLQGKALASLPGTEQRGPLVLVTWGPGAEINLGTYVLRCPQRSQAR